MFLLYHILRNISDEEKEAGRGGWRSKKSCIAKLMRFIISIAKPMRFKIKFKLWTWPFKLEKKSLNLKLFFFLYHIGRNSNIMIELGGKFKCRAFFTRMFLLYHIQRKKTHNWIKFKFIAFFLHECLHVFIISYTKE